MLGPDTRRHDPVAVQAPAGPGVTVVRLDTTLFDFAARTFDADARPSESARSACRGRCCCRLGISMAFASLQALDVHSTPRAVRNGAAEANPLMAPLVNYPAASSR